MSRIFAALVASVCAGLVLTSCSGGVSKEREIVEIPLDKVGIGEIDCGNGCKADVNYMIAELEPCVVPNVKPLEFRKDLRIIQLRVHLNRVDSGGVKVRQDDVKFFDRNDKPIEVKTDTSQHCEPRGSRLYSSMYHEDEEIRPGMIGKNGGELVAASYHVVVPMDSPSVVKWSPEGGSKTYVLPVNYRQG